MPFTGLLDGLAKKLVKVLLTEVPLLFLLYSCIFLLTLDIKSSGYFYTAFLDCCMFFPYFLALGFMSTLF